MTDGRPEWQRITVTVHVAAEDRGRIHELADVLADVVDAVVSHGIGIEHHRGLNVSITQDPMGGMARMETTVSEYGHSLAVNITKQAKRLNIRKGDRVVVTISKIDGGVQD